MRRILDWFSQRSFRLQLIGAAVVSEVVLIAALTYLGIQQMDKALTEQIKARIDQGTILFNAALAPELVERNYSALELTLQLARRDGVIDYAVLRDERNILVVSTGWDMARPLPAVDSDIRKAADSGMVHLQHAILLADRGVGVLRYGLPTGFLQDARRNLLSQVILVASAGIVISLIGLLLLGFRMMRRLGNLTAVASRLAEGDLAVRVGNGSHDEIGRLGAAFDNMAQMLDERIRALHASEDRLALVMRGTSDGVWDWDLRRNTTYFSPRYRELLGYSDEQEFRLMFQFRTSLHPEDRDRTLAALDAAQQQHADGHFDETYRLRCRDGSYRWFRGRGQIQRDEGGEAYRFAGSLSDISSQRAVEKALRESEETFYYAVRGSSDGIWDWNVLENTYYISPRYRELLGYTEEELPNERKSFLGIVHPEDLPYVEEAVRRHFRERTPYDVEYRMHHKDGSWRWFRGRGQAVWNADGRVIRFAGASSDIETRKKSEDSIKSLLAEQQALLDNVLVGIVYLKNRVVMSCNRRFEVLFGYGPGGLIGKTTEMLYPHATRDIYEARGTETYRTLSINSSVSEEIQLKRKDGSLFWGLINGRALDASQPHEGSVWFYLDVTERRLAMEALQEEKDHSEALLAGLPGISALFDLNMCMLSWNQNLENVTGYSRQQLKTMLAHDLYVETDNVIKASRAALELGVVTHGEATLRTADGRIIPYYLYAAPILRGDRKLLVGLGFDITERKAAEAEIRKLNEELEQRVRERTSELVAANKELESFSYSVSHDLVSPLRAINGFSHLIEEDYGSLIDARGREYIGRIRSGTQRMHQLIDDMLALSRVTRNEMKRVSVDLSGIASIILSDMKQMQPEREVTTRIALDIGVIGDPNLLRIALENLLRNAWKFTAKKSAIIEFGTLHREDETVYFVRDSGAGFDMKYAGKLFGAFQRLHGPQEFEGTGIGLAIVQRIIQRHGGRIWAEAAPDQGATFFFTLS